MKFKLKALVVRHKGTRFYSRWTTYCIKADNPFDAIDKCLAKYPGRDFARVAECWPNGNPKIGKVWSMDYLNAHKDEIMIEYDLRASM